MQDIALAGYFKFKYAVTKIYHSCWIGMPVVFFRLVTRIAIGPFLESPETFRVEFGLHNWIIMDS